MFSHWVSGVRSALASSVMTVAQFIPEARPATAKSGSLGFEVEPLLRLGGAPVARIEDKRFDPLVELLIELDIGVILFL